MKVKRILFCVLSFTTLIVNAQRIMSTSRHSIEKLKKDTLFVPLRYSMDFDSAFKLAIKKYWTFSPVSFAEDSEGADNSGIYLTHPTDDRTVGGNYRTCTLIGYDNKKAGILGFQMYFDNDHLKKSPDIIDGIDKTYDHMSCEVIQYIMVLCYQIRRIELEIYSKYEPFRGDKSERIKSYKIFVAQEYIENGVSKEAFTDKLPKCTFLPASEIRDKIIEQKDMQNCAQLILVKSFGVVRLYLIDLKTGEPLLSEQSMFGVNKSGYITTKNVVKILKDI